MDELKQKIDQALLIIDTLEKGILSSAPEVLQGSLLRMMSEIMKVVPAIVQSYERTEWKEYQEEINYWPAQMERLLDASKGEDLFYIYDVLIQETKSSFLEYRQRIEYLPS